MLSYDISDRNDKNIYMLFSDDCSDLLDRETTPQLTITVTVSDGVAEAQCQVSRE